MNTLTIDIGGTNIKYGVMNASAELLFSNEIPTLAHLGGPMLLKRICDLIDGIPYPFNQIGISASGQINSQTGTVIFATDSIPNFTGCNIKQTISDHTGKEVRVENDVNCAVLGEARYGVGDKSGNIIMLTIGTGIGGGIMINDTLYTGSSYSAGEFGHMITHPGGKPCTCGHRGCYEQYASTTALLKEVQSLMPEVKNGRQIMTLYSEENMVIVELVTKWCKEIAIGLASLIHAFNPGTVILGGGIMANERLLMIVKEELHNMLIPSFQHITLNKPKLNNDAGLYGAYSLFKQEEE